jgi:uncharacterized membrane protein (DUF373 family)
MSFVRVVTMGLIILLALVVVLGVVHLGWVLVEGITTPPFAFLEVGELLHFFGTALLLLIGIELVETLRAYLRERVIRAEVILLVAMIALARKIIVLEVTEVSSVSLLGIAAIIIALGVTHFLIRRARGVATQPPGGT